MSLKVYDEGDVVRITGVFRNIDGDLQDPGTCNFIFTTPAGSVTTYVYPTDAELVRESLATFYVDLSITEPGEWHGRWIATGSGASAEPFLFMGRPS